MSQQQQQYPNSPLIWFQLLESGTGELYKGTTTDFVSLPSGSVIAQFRDAVKKKDQDDGEAAVLTLFKSSQLYVYKNKQTFAEGKNNVLEEDYLLDGLGITKKEALVVIVPSSSTYLAGKESGSLQSLQVVAPLVVNNTYLKLDQIDQEIKALENSEEYKTLAMKNRAWAVPKPTEQEKGEWQLLKEKLAELNTKRRDNVNIILSMNSHSVKKVDKTRKGYKKDTAIKDERLLLSDVATKMWERFSFDCEYDNKPTFGDFKRAAGFKDEGDVRDYFRKKENGQVKEDKIKDSLDKAEWILLIELNQHVNKLLHGTLIKNDDESLRLVMEHDFYEKGRDMAEKIVNRIYGSGKKVDIKDAASDSSTSPTEISN